MQKLYLPICYSACFLAFVIIIFKNFFLTSFKQCREFFSIKSLCKEENDKIEIHFYIFLIATVLVANLMFLCRTSSYDHLPFFYKNGFSIHTFNVAFLFFVSGMLCSNGRKLFFYFLDNFLRVSSSFLISSTYFLFLRVKEVYHSILIPFLLIILLIWYFIYLHKEKNSLKNSVFILQFIWFLFIFYNTIFIFIRGL